MVLVAARAQLHPATTHFTPLSSHWHRFVVSGGSKGVLRVWAWWRLSPKQAYCACVAEVDVLGARRFAAASGAGARAGEVTVPTWAQIQGLMWNSDVQELVVVTQDHAFVSVGSDTLSKQKQIIG